MDDIDDIIRLISYIDFQIDRGDFCSQTMKPIQRFLKQYLKEVLSYEDQD